MGTEFWLVNEKNKTVFELGKSNLFTEFFYMPMSDDDAILFFFKEEFLKQVVDSYKENYYDSVENSDHLKYMLDVGEILFDFIDGCDPQKDLKLVNDSDDSHCDLKNRNYICLGSRYNGTENYHEYIRNENKYLGSLHLVEQFDFNLPIAKLKKLLKFL